MRSHANGRKAAPRYLPEHNDRQVPTILRKIRSPFRIARFRAILPHTGENEVFSTRIVRFKSHGLPSIRHEDPVHLRSDKELDRGQTIDRPLPGKPIAA
jgi:hypothetical protein